MNTDDVKRLAELAAEWNVTPVPDEAETVLRDCIEDLVRVLSDISGHLVSVTASGAAHVHPVAPPDSDKTWNRSWAEVQEMNAAVEAEVYAVGNRLAQAMRAEFGGDDCPDFPIIMTALSSWLGDVFRAARPGDHEGVAIWLNLFAASYFDEDDNGKSARELLERSVTLAQQAEAVARKLGEH